MATKQHQSLMEHHGGWQKPVRRIIVLIGAMTAALVIAAPAVQSAQETPVPQKSSHTYVKNSSSGKVLPCVPPQASRMEPHSDVQKTATRTQRNAGDPSLSYAMVLSMALGLRSVAGPVENMKGPAAVKTESHGSSAGTKRMGSDRYALSDDSGSQCPGRVSMK